MTQSNQNHQNLYLEILKKAQKESDHHLVQLIIDKLGSQRPLPRRTIDGCQVYSLPQKITPRTALESEAIDWKNSRVWRDLFMVMSSFGFIMTWFLFFFQKFLPIKSW